MEYAETIKTAMIIFPFIALLMSAPFILIQYHKYGSISFFKALIIYSFVLYFICAYFLVILPLPKISEVAVLTSTRTQLIPFKFIFDFIQHTSLDITNIHTYLQTFKQSYFYVPVYNIFLTMPFGIYLRYYFKCNMKKVVLYSFLLSLFYELTQLSGLYFIYPRGYRLFDIDDLFLNTLGGVIGFLIATPIIKMLPKNEEVEYKAKKRGKIISGFRRTTTLCLDLFLLMLFELIPTLVMKNNYGIGYIIVILIYYFIIPIFLNNSTLGQKFLNIRVLNYNNKKNIIRLYFRNIIFALIYIGIPIVLPRIVKYLSINDSTKAIVGLIMILSICLIYFIIGIKYLFTNKQMLYEKISKTKLVSTINLEPKDIEIVNDIKTEELKENG